MARTAAEDLNRIPKSMRDGAARGFLQRVLRVLTAAEHHGYGVVIPVGGTAEDGVPASACPVCREILGLPPTPYEGWVADPDVTVGHTERCELADLLSALDGEMNG